MSALQGAALAGARTFTATSAQGLTYMFEPYSRAPGMRLPMVCALVTRDGPTPTTVWGGQQDAMMAREAGCDSNVFEKKSRQDVLDTIIMAYKIAEHRDVVLPVNVCIDGNYLGYGVTRLEVPDQGVGGCLPAAAGRQLARGTRPGPTDVGGSPDRRHRTTHLRALPQRSMPRHAERVAGHRGSARGMGRTLRPAASRAG